MYIRLNFFIYLITRHETSIPKIWISRRYIWYTFQKHKFHSACVCVCGTEGYKTRNKEYQSTPKSRNISSLSSRSRRCSRTSDPVVPVVLGRLRCDLVGCKEPVCDWSRSWDGCRSLDHECWSCSSDRKERGTQCGCGYGCGHMQCPC